MHRLLRALLCLCPTPRILGLASSALVFSNSVLFGADTYQFAGGSFTDPNSWVDTTTGGHGLPQPGDTAQFTDGTTTTPGGGPIGTIITGGLVTFTGGSLTVGQAEGRYVLQGDDLTVQKAGGLSLTMLTVSAGSQVQALADTSGQLLLPGGQFIAQGGFFNGALDISQAGSAQITGDASLNLVPNGLVDGVGSTLRVGGTLSFTNGGFTIQNGATVVSSGAVVGADEGRTAPLGDDGTMVTVRDAGSQWSVNGPLQVGLDTGAPGLNNVYVQDGAMLTAQSLELGVGDKAISGVATAAAPGAGTSGGSISITGPIRVGVAGQAGLTIPLGRFEASGSFPVEIAVETNSYGRVDIAGANTVANFGATPLHVGVAGTGLFTVGGMNQFTSGEVQVALEATSGTGPNGGCFLDVQDLGSAWTVNGPLTIGVAGHGNADVSSGAQLTSVGEAVIGQEAGAVGIANLAGLAGDGKSTVLTPWSANGGLTVGESGTGTLTLQWGGSLVLPAGGDLTLGSAATGVGTVTVTGNPLFGYPLPPLRALLDARGASLTVGDAGQGTLTANVGGQILSADTDVGSQTGGKGSVTLTDPQTTWGVAGDLTVGSEGAGTLLVENQAALSTTGSLVAGEQASANGKVTFTGPGTLVTVSGELTDGGDGSGTTLVELGALLTTDSATLAEQAQSTGNLTVSGGDALMATRTDLTIGGQGTGKLTVTGPATVHVGKDATVAEALDSRSTATLNSGGVWIVEGDFTAAGKGIAGVSVTDGGHLFTLGSATLAEEAGSGATLTLSGRGTNGLPATLTYAGELAIGEQGDAKMVLTNDALALIATNGSGIISLAPHTTATATLSIAGTNSFLEANTFEVAVGENEAGGHGTNVLVGGGRVSVHQDVETGDGGVIDVRGGSFTVGTTNPAAAFGTLQVNPGGRLAGCGHIKGKVINAGGTLAPGCSPGTLTIEGDYTQTSAGALEVRVTGGVGGGSSNDVLAVTGNAVVAGKLTISFLNGFAPRQGQSFVFLTSGSAVAGNFEQVVITGLATGFQYGIGAAAGGGLSLTAQNDGVAVSPPLLSLGVSGSQVVISWPASASNFTLQMTTNFASGIWNTVVAPTNPYTVSPSGPAGFFRLISH